MTIPLINSLQRMATPFTSPRVTTSLTSNLRATTSLSSFEYSAIFPPQTAKLLHRHSLLPLHRKPTQTPIFQQNLRSRPWSRMIDWRNGSPVSNGVTNSSATPRLANWKTTPTSSSFTEFSSLIMLPPPLTSSRDVNVHKNVYKRDQDLATIQARLAHLTRPIDATVHAILASNPMDIEDPVLINTIETFDILRHNLAFIATEITHLRQEALYRDKKVIPPADPNDKTPLVTHQQFIDQEKFTHSLRKASGYVGRGRGRGRGRGGFNNLGNRNGQQNNNFDNSLENSGNNNANNGSQSSNSDTSTNSNNNNNSGNNGNHFQQSSTTRGRGRGRGGRQ